jgi:hypothetical protein
MPRIDRFKLRLGPYLTPRFRYRSVVQCEARGHVKIVGISDGRIPWPIGKSPKPRAQPSPVLYGDLARAVRNEAEIAVAYWFGVSLWRVRQWRRAIDVDTQRM